ncbi:MAG: XTP/dITP diphosphatase [Clostridia bacterium]|nr:XTP/dITP diphosphatase [Clostridia bacterium]
MKNTIIVATGNAHKVTEMAAILDGVRDIELVTMRDAGVTGDIEENGTTFEENAKIKARTVAALTGKPAIADDSGLSVDALGGAPGIYSARYASVDGGNASDQANIDKLLEDMKLIPSGERTARFVSAIALVFPDGREYCTVGVCEGVITCEMRGNGGFGYDPIFYCTAMAKTFGELSAEEKNSISHRNRALEQLKVILRDIEF